MRSQPFQSGSRQFAVAQPEIMQTTSRLHYIISKVVCSASQRMHHNVAAFNAANLMLNFNSLFGNFSGVA